MQELLSHTASVKTYGACPLLLVLRTALKYDGTGQCAGDIMACGSNRDVGVGAGVLDVMLATLCSMAAMLARRVSRGAARES